MLELYRPGSSFLHKLPPGIKLLTLATCGTVLFLVDGIPVILGFFAVTLALFPLYQMPLRTAWQQVRPALWILIICHAPTGHFVDDGGLVDPDHPQF